MPIDPSELTQLQGNAPSMYKDLYLEAENIGPDEAKTIAEAITHNTVVDRINLRNNHIGDEGASAIAEALKINTAVRQLYLSSDFEGMDPDLDEFITDERCNNIGPQGAKSIAQALEINSTLEELALDGNPLGDEGIKFFAKSIQLNQSLRSISLDGTSISIKGAIAIIDATKTFSSLRALSLRHNNIGCIGAVLIAENIKTNTVLEKLDLKSNGLGLNQSIDTDDGIIALAEALKINTTLQLLDLTDNYINLLGAKAIAEAIKVNVTLKTLLMYDNRILQSGITAIIQAMATNYSIVSLELGVYNDKDLMQYLKRNKKIVLCLAPIQAYCTDSTLDFDTIQSQLTELETLFPALIDEHNLLPETDYLAENHRLLSALGYLSMGSPNEACILLERSFSHPHTQHIADKAISLALMVSSAFDDATDIEKMAHYQWMACSAKNAGDFTTYSVALAGLSNPGQGAMVDKVFELIERHPSFTEIVEPFDLPSTLNHAKRVVIHTMTATQVATEAKSEKLNITGYDTHGLFSGQPTNQSNELEVKEDKSIKRGHSGSV